MKAGDLNRLITVLRREQTGTTIANEPIFEWLPVRRISANVRYLKADERFDGNQVFAWSTVVFKTRWFPGLEPTDVISFDGRNYNVSGYAEIGRRVGLEITGTWRQGDLE